MSDPEKPKPPFELDPFALPQETKGRFRMFIAAAVVFAWSLGAWWVEVPNPYAVNWWAEPEFQAHIEQYKQAPSLAMFDRRSVEQFRRSRLFSQGLEYIQFEAGRMGISIAAAAATAFLGLVLYLLHPWFLARKYKTVPLEEPLAVEEARSLAALAGVPPPRLAIKSGFLDGLAFGRKGREILALGGLRQLLSRRWSPHLRAIALHELAHIVNGDIRTRVGSSSLWLALTTLLTVAGGLALGTSLLLHGEPTIPVFRPSFLPPLEAGFLAGGGLILARGYPKTVS